MTLCEVLDEVRFGNVGRLCVAICGEDDYLDNFKEGKYWELECGNWHEGSSSPTTPEIPEEFMDADVTQIECETDVVGIYSKLGRLRNDNWNYTVILVEEPEDFDAEEYWTEENMHEPIKYIEWPYSISRELWYEIRETVPNMGYRMLALNNLLHIGINTAKNLTDEEIESHRIDESKLDENHIITVRPDEILRATRAVAQKLEGCNLDAIMALYELEEMGYAFNKNL